MAATAARLGSSGLWSPGCRLTQVPWPPSAKEPSRCAWGGVLRCPSPTFEEGGYGWCRQIDFFFSRNDTNSHETSTTPTHGGGTKRRPEVGRRGEQKRSQIPKLDQSQKQKSACCRTPGAMATLAHIPFEHLPRAKEHLEYFGAPGWCSKSPKNTSGYSSIYLESRCSSKPGGSWCPPQLLGKRFEAVQHASARCGW